MSSKYSTHVRYKVISHRRNNHMAYKNYRPVMYTGNDYHHSDHMYKHGMGFFDFLGDVAKTVLPVVANAGIKRVLGGGRSKASHKSIEAKMAKAIKRMSIKGGTVRLM